MRIITGSLKGRKLNPKGLDVRPTTDFAKEGLFSILNSHTELQGIQVLDIFSGTGSISFEFVSRGATKVISVDSNYKCISFIKETAEKLGIRSISAYQRDSFSFLNLTQEKYDIIFADPPYDHTEIIKIHEIVFEKNLLKPGGWLIIEHAEKISFAGFDHIFLVRNYGKVHFSIFVQPV